MRCCHNLLIVWLSTITSVSLAGEPSICPSDLTSATEEGLQSSLFHPNDEIAIDAAWRLALRASDREMGHKLEFKVVDSAQVIQFASFIEGRLHVPVPRVWTECLGSFDFDGIRLSGVESALSDRRNKASRIYRSPPYIDSFGSSPSWNSPKNISLKMKRDGVHVKIVDEEIIVDNSTYKTIASALSLVNGATACTTKTEMLVTFHNAIPSVNQRVLCFRCSSNELLWSSKVNDHIADGSTKGNGAEIEPYGLFLNTKDTLPCRAQRIVWAEGDEVIYLFGLSTESVYIQGFRLADGADVFCFCTGPRKEHLVNREDEKLRR